MSHSRPLRATLSLALLFCTVVFPAHAADTELWALAQSIKSVHSFSTLFTAQDVRDHLSTPAGLDRAIDWCKRTAVTHVYIETFRGPYQAKREALESARDRFRAEGFAVSGCVTTVVVGKRSTGWKELISCYTDLPTQKRLQEVFEFTASIFDEIMIDDFYFTDCACPDCDKARASKTATVGGKVYPVGGDSWADYRCELMVRISRDLVLAPSKKVNPKATLIIKYPQWYDRFHERGYEVVRESADFDRIWVGTETRDYADQRWGGTPQYEAYFIMRWLGGIGGEKCGGGWYDPYGTTEATYVEQARQTVLGGAKQSLLFCYGSLQKETGPKNVEALRRHIPELLSVAGQVAKRKIVGVAAYKPANSPGEKEQRIYDFVGMLGLPLVPCHEFPADAPAAFFPVHAMKDPQFPAKLAVYIATGRPVLITDGLKARLPSSISLDAPNVQVLNVKGEPKSLLSMPDDQVNALRAPLLRPFKTSFVAPARVGFYLFADGSHVVENFNDTPAAVAVGSEKIDLAPRAWTQRWRDSR